MEIKKHELRLGNIVKDGNDIITLGNDEMICLFAGRCIYDAVKLSKKMLKMLGYESWGIEVANEYESYERFVLHNVVDGTSNHEVHLITSTYGGDVHKEYVTSIDKDERQYNYRMEYVHDLQNACFKEFGFNLSFSEA